MADILGIRDKTVSKWEAGNGFPEISLLLPLCNELDISVNELLSAQILSVSDYSQKAEENMINLIKEKAENKQKWKSMALTGCISILSFLTLILIVVQYTDAISTQAKLIIVFIGCTILATGLFAIMQGQRTIGYYKCSCCDETFIPSVKPYILGLQFMSRRRLECPFCGKKTWCRKFMSKE